MRDQLSDEQWAELLAEPDAFKLAIRGQTALEADIDAGIAQAFDGPVTEELLPGAPSEAARLKLPRYAAAAAE